MPLIPFGIPASAVSPFALIESVVVPGFIRDPLTPEKLLTPYPMWAETKEALRYLNKLFAEGLLTDTFITDSSETLFRQAIARGDMFAFIAAGHYPYHSAYGELYNKVREHTPNAIIANANTFRPTPTAPRVEYRASNPTYGYRWFIPASSRNVELTVKVLDFLSSEAGYGVGGLGILGEDYNMVNNVPTPINRDRYLARVPWIEPQYGCMAKPYPRPQDKDLFLTNYIKDFNPDYYAQIRQEVSFLSDSKAFPPTISAPTPVSDRLTPVVNEYWNNALARIMQAPSANFDRVYDDAVREYRSMGGDEIVSEAQRLYRR
jgi:ABC-type glycerol-3-phosphate transport system substrate-binding protein